MKRAALILALCATPLHAQDWRPLTGPEISEALTGRTLTYETAWQDFRASGVTLYNAGADSWGAWRVTGDQYCSEWPPTGGWSCYDVALSSDGTTVQFSRGADISVGRYAPE